MCFILKNEATTEIIIPIITYIIVIIEEKLVSYFPSLIDMSGNEIHFVKALRLVANSGCKKRKI